jgi:hypothetical protein
MKIRIEDFLIGCIIGIAIALACILLFIGF